MQQCAESFAEELSLSRSWRHIPFREASDKDEVLLNMTLNVEDAGVNTCKDWVVRLGMGAYQRRSKQSSHQSVIWHKDPCSSLAREETNSMDGCNMNLTHTKNTHKRIRESYASGKLPKHQKLSVAGKWCGIVKSIQSWEVFILQMLRFKHIVFLLEKVLVTACPSSQKLPRMW